MGCVLGPLWLYDRWVGGALRLATGWAVLGALLFSGCCLASRRLHDLGRAGWWTGPAWLLFIVAWPGTHGRLGVGCAVVVLLVGAWLSAAPGQRGFNRFGPPRGRR